MCTTPDEIVKTGAGDPVGGTTSTVPGRNEMSASSRAAPTVAPRVSSTMFTTAVSPILLMYVDRSVRRIGAVFEAATITKIESLEKSDSATTHASPGVLAVIFPSDVTPATLGERLAVVTVMPDTGWPPGAATVNVGEKVSPMSSTRTFSDDAPNVTS